jgi:hypothetical protein
MGLVVSTTPTYATVDDVRAFPGVPSTLTDDQINDALELAVEVIDDYTGTFFGEPQATTILINDVRRPILPLPTPFSDVTAVSVNGTALDTTQWIVEDWGLRLYESGYLDPDGFPRWAVNDLPVGLAYDWGPHGVQVSVTGTFGWPTVPAKVKRAAVLLAARFATQSTSDLVPDSRLKQLQVEGYRAMWDDTKTNLDTTGDLAVDRLPARYISVDGLVG